MNPSRPEIRPERPEDFEQVRRVNVEAFGQSTAPENRSFFASSSACAESAARASGWPCAHAQRDRNNAKAVKSLDMILLSGSLLLAIDF
jgi:hypothetical protein